MPEFAYHSVNKAGHVSDGTMVADDELALERRLREIGYWLIDSRVQSPSKRRKRTDKVPRRELIDFFMGMTSLLTAGIPVADALAAMAEETVHPALRRILEDISINVQAGNDVSSSLRNYPTVFNDQLCNLVQAGEHGGNLINTFEDLAEHLDWIERIMADIKQASIYPLMIISAVAGLIGLMFVFVVPSFASIFSELDIELPALTRGVVAIGEFAQQFWWAIILAIVAAVVFVRTVRSTHPAIAMQIDRMKLRIPVFGRIQSLLVQSQFVHNLALMLKAGVPILDALRLSRGISKNLVMDAAINDAANTVQGGGRISDALREHAVVSSLTLRMIIVGEDAGRLDTTLQQIADRFDAEIPRQIKRVFSILEPMITLTLVVIVGLIAGALFLPMFALVSGLS
ncbi:MAG: type II secretion system F family protein [Pseudomonadota bacterium]